MDHSLSATGFYAEPPLSRAPVPRGGASQRAPGFTASPPRPLAPVVELPRAEAAPAPGPEAKAPSLERILLKFALVTPAQLREAMREGAQPAARCGRSCRSAAGCRARISSGSRSARPRPRTRSASRPRHRSYTGPAASGGRDPAGRGPSGSRSRFHPDRPGPGPAADPAAGLHASGRDGAGRPGFPAGRVRDCSAAVPRAGCRARRGRPGAQADSGRAPGVGRGSIDGRGSGRTRPRHSGCRRDRSRDLVRGCPCSGCPGSAG
jgi:hypothetical protein